MRRWRSLDPDPAFVCRGPFPFNTIQWGSKERAGVTARPAAAVRVGSADGGHLGSRKRIEQ
jgi:hypothetical protein